MIIYNGLLARKKSDKFLKPTTTFIINRSMNDNAVLHVGELLLPKHYENKRISIRLIIEVDQEFNIQQGEGLFSHVKKTMFQQ